MKKVVLVLVFNFISCLCFAQYTLKFNYIEVCSEERRQLILNLEENSNSYSFFGESRTFTQNEIDQGKPIIWLGEVYKRWTKYYPCSEIRNLIIASVKASSEKSDVDINAPVVVIQSDLGFQNSAFITSGGFTNTDVLSNNSEGYNFTLSSSKIISIGYYRVTSYSKGIKGISNFNLIAFDSDFLGSLSIGVTGVNNKLSGFIFNSHIFGNLNGYRFQDSSILIGVNYPFLSFRTFEVSGLLLTSYTYRVKVFKIDYWFEDYVAFSPYINLTYRLTGTFGLNLSYTSTFRTDIRKENEFGILLGGRVFF